MISNTTQQNCTLDLMGPEFYYGPDLSTWQPTVFGVAVALLEFGFRALGLLAGIRGLRESIQKPGLGVQIWAVLSKLGFLGPLFF